MKITEDRNGKITIEGRLLGIAAALETAATFFNDKAEVPIRLAKVAHDDGNFRQQAENEIRAERLLERSTLFLQAWRSLPPGKRSSIERLDIPSHVLVEG